MTQTTDERLSKIHATAMAQFRRTQGAQRDERMQCLADRRFYSVSGAQWEGPLQDQYANKPKFEVNKVALSVIRIFNEYRNNRISVNFIPKDGSENDTLAETCNGLYRADEQDSVAEEAFDNGYEEAVGGGFGAWRLCAEYEDEDNEDESRQRIRFYPIFDADSSVFFDLDAKRQDKSDAKHCFVLHSKSRQAYIDEWNDDPTTWPKEIHQNEFDWSTPDIVYEAEYYVVEIKRETIFVYETLDGTKEEYTQQDFENDLTLRETLEAIGSREVEQKKRKVRRVHKYLMSGGKVLEDCGIIAGKYIPVVPVYGKRWFVDNVERCMGQVRLAKDVQRLKNMQLSRLGEISAMSPVSKPIFAPEQVAGLEVYMAEDNIKNYPYWLRKREKGPDGMPIIAPQEYTKPPEIPAATAALLTITEQDMQDLLGNQQNAEEMISNVSGKAVELIQTKLDMQSYIYMSNMGKAVKRTGEIWLSMAKDILTGEGADGRKMKTIASSGKAGAITLMNPVLVDDVMGYENDLSTADMDVAVSIGPTSQSARAGTVRALTGLLQITDDPQDRKVLTGLTLMNMEGEGLSDVNEYYRRQMIKMGVVKPTDEEAAELEAELANTPPDPQSEYLRKAAEEAEANAKSANASTLLKIEQAKKAAAETAETYAGIDLKEKGQALDAVQTFANLSVETARASEDRGAQ